ncbi:hypothetical protein FRC11_010985 [Ceratobasidium sp. 423]|nr:hypothetical protein FRC11_010985 [Ceratobasidium sp. 423]
MVAAWFTDKENEWLVQNYLHAFIEVDHSAMVVYKGETYSGLQGFLAEVIDEFTLKFPYHHYDTPIEDIPQHLCEKQVRSVAQWAKLPEGMVKSGLQLGSQDADTSVMRSHTDPDTASNSEGEKEQDSNGLVPDWTDEELDLEDTSKSAITENCHAASPNTSNPDSRTLLATLATGTESRSRVSDTPCHDYSSDYSPSQVVVSKWNAATKYLVEVMGSHWADLDAEALGSVIAQHAEENRYEIVSLRVFPKGVNRFVSPLLMTDEETIAWGAHIRVGDNHEIEEGRQFQFDMPLMGHPQDWYQLVHKDHAQLNYGPDAYAYVRQLSNYKEMPIPS